MTGEPARLRLMKQAETPGTAAAPAGSEERAFTAVSGIVPDDGRLAHHATHVVKKNSPGPSSRTRTENELVGFVCDLLQAPDSAVGTVAAGLSDAALMVLRGARAARPHLRRPTVVLPQSAHPAWFVAAGTVGVTPVVIPVDAEGRVPVGPLTTAIKEDTVLVVASAPSYTHGTVDPVAWVAAATTAKGVPLHVDASSGGWALAYAELTGRLRQPWGFAVQGVASVTIDVGPDRGTDGDLSVLLHRTAADRRATQLAALSLRGPLTTAVAWQPSGGLLADANETLREVGHERCAELALDALDATSRLAEGLVDALGITLAARPDANTLTLRADASCDVFVFADALQRRGWTAQPFLPEMGGPMVRLPVTAATLPIVDECLSAIEEAIAETLERGRADVDPTLERLLERLDSSEVDEYSAGLLLDAAAVLDSSDPDQPDQRAATNLLLRAARPGVREVLLAARHDRDSVPVRHGAPRLVEIPPDED
ncbi:aminotransferase class V-fold PLP-dependent enzyme [soil metagenome]